MGLEKLLAYILLALWICTKCHGNPLNSCWDILVLTKVVDRLTDRKAKSLKWRMTENEYRDLKQLISFKCHRNVKVLNLTWCLPFTKIDYLKAKRNAKFLYLKCPRTHCQSVVFKLRPVTLLTYWTSKIGISTQRVHPVLIHAYCITTIPACKVGQNIYLGIICPQVHDVLNIQHWGEGWWCLRRRDCNGWNEFIASPWDNAFTEDKQNLCRFPLVPLAVCCSCQGLEIRSDVFCASTLMLFSVFFISRCMVLFHTFGVFVKLKMWHQSL